MIAFATVDLLYTITNLVEIFLVVGIVMCGFAFCWLGWQDYHRELREERRLRHPSASNVTLILPPVPPFDWDTEGCA